MDRNAILATVLVIAILLGYQWYLARFEAPKPEAEPTGQPVAAAPAEVRTVVPAAPSATVRKDPAHPRGFTPTAERSVRPRDVVVETPLVRVVLSTAGARATSWQLKAYRLDSGAPVDLVAAGANPRTGEASPLATWAAPEELGAIYEAERESLTLKAGDAPAAVVFRHVSATGLEQRKSLTFSPDHYTVGVEVTTRNLAAAAQAAHQRLAWGPGLRNSTDKDKATLQPPTIWLDGKRHQEDGVAQLKGEKLLEGKTSWAALQDSFFAAALLPEGEGVRAFVARGQGDQPVVGLAGPALTLQEGAQAQLRATLYAGPRDLDILKAVGQDLDSLVDLGWFDFLARPALWLLKFLYFYTGNYGLAIIIVTILQKVAFHPLTHKSLKSMQAMQAIQPKVQALQERFKNNPQKKQEETMALYKKHGVNPMGGCLPMLVQIPIFIALYNALSSSVEMWQAHFLWIRDLTQPDALFNLPIWGGSHIGFNLLALLMGASMWIQQKMSPTVGDPRQAQIMLWMMPILFTWMFWSFPSGLVVYWLVNNILQVGQQWLIMGRPGKPAPADAGAA